MALSKFVRAFLRNGLLVIYGNRGSGKSTFLIQLAEELQEEYDVTLIITNKKRDLDKLKLFSLDATKVSIIEEESMCASLEAIIKLISLPTDDSQIIMFDDPIPITVLVERELGWEEARDLGLFMSLLATLMSDKILIMTVQEHSTLPLPRRWKMFTELNARYLRIYKKHRIREIYEVKLSGLPNYGEFWDKSLKPLIRTKKVASMRLAATRFLVLEEE